MLRRLRQNHGPLGLLYGAYCPPDLHIRGLDEQPGTNGGRPGRSSGIRRTGWRMLGGSPAAVAQSSSATTFYAIGPSRKFLTCPSAPYGPEHRALFAGRDDDITRFALVPGSPGDPRARTPRRERCRQDVVPPRRLDSVPRGRYRYLAPDHSDSEHGEGTSPALFIRATDDPAGQIARAIVVFAAKPLEYPTPNGETVNADLPAALALAPGTTEPPAAAALSERLLADPSLFSQLSLAARSLPVTPVLVIDQAEECSLWPARPLRIGGAGRVLDMVRQVCDCWGDFKLIVSLRTEYYGRLVSALRRGLVEADGVREYLLADLDVPAMVRVIRRPTFHERLPHAEEIPFEKYRGFDYAEGVPEHRRPGCPPWPH